VTSGWTVVPGVALLGAWLADVPPGPLPSDRWPIVPLALVGIGVLTVAVIVVRRMRRRGPTDQA
jgi:hypothetical protein